MYELFDVDDTIRQEILAKTSETEIIQKLREKGIRSMNQDGLLKVCSGITTMHEVMSIG